MILQCLEPAPSPVWPLQFLKHAEENGTFGVLTLFFEQDGGEAALHFSDQDASDEDLEEASGSVLGRITAWPDLTMGFDVRAPRLGLPQFIVDVEDGDKELETLILASDAYPVLSVTAWIRVGSNGISATMWPRRWTGKLVGWMRGDADVVRLVLQHDHGWATRTVVQHSFNASEFPYAHAQALGKPIPLAVGTLDSRGSAPGELYANPYGWLYGAVPAYYIDKRAGEYRFAAILGHGWEVPRVWLEDVQQVEGTDYDITRPTINGYKLTCIEFVADPGGNPTVRCDLTGYDHLGDGTGRPLRTIASQLRHLAIQYGAFGGRGVGVSGTLSGTGQPYGAELFDDRSLAEFDDYIQGNRRRAQARLSNVNSWTQGRATALYLANPALRVIDLINHACLGTGVYPYWNEAGKVAFGILDHRRRRTYHDQWHWIRDEDLIEGRITQEPPGPRPYNRALTGISVVKDAHGQLTQTQSQAGETIPNPWAVERMGQAELVPYATAQDSGWTETGGGTDPHDSQVYPSWSADSKYSSWAAATGTFRVQCRLSETGPYIPQGVPVLVEVRFRAKGTGTAKAGVYIGGVAYYDASVGDIALTTTWTDYLTATFLVNPDTAEAWLSEDLNPDLLQVVVSATGAAQVRATRARAYLMDGGPAATLVRERLARALLLSSRPPAITVGEVDATRGAIRPGDPFSWSTETALAYGSEGWGLEPEERRLHYLCSATWRPGDGTMTLRAVDARDLQVPLWEDGMALGLAPESGAVRLGSWQAGGAWAADGRLFSRITADDGDPTGEDSITGPWGSSVTIPADHERYTSLGLHLKALNTTPNPDVSPDLLTYVWRHDQQVWPIDGGTAIFEVRLDALTAGQTYTVFRCGSDVLVVDVDADAVRFRRTLYGTDYDAEVDVGDAGVADGQPFVMAIRWTPGEGGLVREDSDGNEEDVPPYTISLWVRPADETFRATDVTSVPGYPGDLNMGHDAGSNILRGHLRLVRAWRSLLTDDEIEAKLEALIQ